MKNEFMEKRSKKFNELMIKNKMNALVVISPENVLYSTGAYIMTQKLIRDRLEIALFSPNREPIFIVCGIEESGIKEQTWIKDIRPYVEFKESPVQFLVDALIEMGLEKGHIGIEKHYWNAYYYTELINAVPDATFIECQRIFEDVRMIKDPDEVEILTRASKATRKALEAAFLTAKSGDTELDIAKQIKNNLMNQGADETAFLVLGTGKRSILVHPMPADITLSPGDIVKADYGGLFSGYYSDLARSVVVEKPSQIQIEVYKKLATIQKKIINAMKPGIRCCDLFNKCKELYEENELPFIMPHIGHGLGLELHEDPILSPLNEKKLQKNMVINVEPLVITDGFCIHLEDLVLITNNGVKILTGAKMSNEIPVIN